MKRNKKTMISLFSGAGGLDHGLAAAGFTNRLCIEIDELAKQTLQLNHPSWKLASPGDIHALTPSSILAQARLRPRELTLLAGGPPCQPFSKSGYWVSGDTNRLTDPRAKTLKAYLDLIRFALPEAILLENVKGIGYSDKDEALRLFFEELDSINKEQRVNYRPYVVVLDAASFGVPQSRERVFVVASRDGKRFAAPNPTHFPPESDEGKKKPFLTAWDAIGDLDTDIWPSELNPTGKWARLLPTIPEGENYLWHTARSGGYPLFGWRTRYWSFLLKLAKNKPSWTIQAQPGPATGPFHWKGRLLSVRELARLQTFPDHYKFAGDRRAAHKQIGNAVPPVIGELFGLEIRRQFFNERVRSTLRLKQEKKINCPKPETPKKLPKEYLQLIGDYEDHPGKGKGPGAQKRGSKERAYA